MSRAEFERAKNGLSYRDYLEIMQAAAEAPAPVSADSTGAERQQYTILNVKRQTRIDRNYIVPGPLKAQIARMTEPQLWMVLTEPWCGDSAQCLPYIHKFAACNPNIELKILLRDTNLDIMDAYLTDGKRSIPILAAFAANGETLFRWGPRPRTAAVLFARLKAEGMAKEEILHALHLWYGRNRGAEIEAEFGALFEQVLRNAG